MPDLLPPSSPQFPALKFWEYPPEEGRGFCYTRSDPDDNQWNTLDPSEYAGLAQPGITPLSEVADRFFANEETSEDDPLFIGWFEWLPLPRLAPDIVIGWLIRLHVPFQGGELVDQVCDWVDSEHTNGDEYGFDPVSGRATQRAIADWLEKLKHWAIPLISTSPAAISVGKLLQLLGALEDVDEIIESVSPVLSPVLAEILNNPEHYTALERLQSELWEVFGFQADSTEGRFFSVMSHFEVTNHE